MPPHSRRPGAASRSEKRGGRGKKGRERQTRSGALSGSRGPLTNLFSKNHLALIAILLLAFVLRGYRLMENFPIVGDEGIYLRWAEIIQNQGQWFISLLDGKQPLSYWFYALTRFAWDGDPLLAARLISAAAGVIAAYGIFLIGRRLSGELAGLLGALFYALLPWAIMYDRLAFTEALVNLGGVAVVFTSLKCFDREQKHLRWTIAAGLALGLAIFCKTTAALFGFFPALAGVLLARRPAGPLLMRLSAIHGLALVFPLISWLGKPEVATFGTTNMLFHQTFFFVDPLELLKNPLIMAPKNFGLLMAYVPYYLTWPTAVASLVSILYLVWRREPGIWLLASVSLLPIAVQIFVLRQMFPTRYPFPHIWPLLLLIGIAAARLQTELKSRLGRGWAAAVVSAAVVVLAAGPMARQSAAVLRNPKENISPGDSGYFLGTYAHTGYGVREAIDFLISESRKGQFILLTDAIWSVPADAMFPYLNHQHGIRVHEAWWVQLSATHPIMPNGKVELLRSHWERVKGGELDFRSVKRVYYVTDTNHNKYQDVMARQPTARILRRFPKPGGEYFIDVYRLK